MHTLYLTKVDKGQNQQRFYVLHVAPTLFGEWTLVREWGRIGRGGQIKIDYFETQQQAVQALLDLMKAKQKRGYDLESSLDKS